MTDEYTDARITHAVIKIRDRMAQLTREYKEEYDKLRQKKTVFDTELLRRLQERGAESTRTEFGTAYIVEEMSASCADEQAFFKFVLDSRDLDFFERRIKIGHLREWMSHNKGRLPPGLNVFRQLQVQVRRPNVTGAKDEE